MSEAVNAIGKVMLVDDNDTDNFISRRIIEITKFADDVIVNNMEIFHLQKSVGILHRKYLSLLKEY